MRRPPGLRETWAPPVEGSTNAMTRLELFLSARQKAKAALARAPYMFPLESVIRQLDYLIRVEEGVEPDRGPLKTIDLGLVAARDLENFDRELADLLHEVSAEARRMQPQ